MKQRQGLILLLNRIVDNQDLSEDAAQVMVVWKTIAQLESLEESGKLNSESIWQVLHGEPMLNDAVEQFANHFGGDSCDADSYHALWRRVQALSSPTAHTP